jgi:hypothetical protein
MNLKAILLSAFILSCSFTGLNAQCTGVIDSDNYSSSAAWTATGAGNVTVSSGAVTFADAADGVYDRVYRPLAATLSDTYFKAEFKFTIIPNAASFGVGTNLLALSAGTLDPISYDNSQSFALTNQDGFIIELNTANIHDNNINNWFIQLDYKDGATRVTGPNTIPISSSVLTYYLVFERTSLASTTINLYSDAAHTVLVGQAINPTVATVTGLNTIQHGVTTFGYTSRHFNGSVDDVAICDNSTVVSNCARIVDTDNFSNSSPWTATGAGNVTVSGGTCTFANAADGAYDRIYRPLASTLSDTYFKAEFKFTIIPNSAGNGVGTNIFALSAGTLDPISYDNSQSYALTNQDGFIVELNCASTSDNNINNWFIQLDYKDGATRTTGPNTIALSSSTLTYYVVFERTSTTSTTINVYSDAAHTMSVGQAINPTVATVTGLNTLQHGVTTFGWNTRHFNGSVDDVTICDDFPDAIETNELNSEIHLYPNPSLNGHVYLDLGNSNAEMVLIYNDLGQLVQQTAVHAGSQNMELTLSPGFYSVVIVAGEKRSCFKQIVE